VLLVFVALVLLLLLLVVVGGVLLLDALQVVGAKAAHFDAPATLNRP
jgi:hypothetical protein